MFLRLSGWDHKRFGECLVVLKRDLDQATEIQKQALYDAILRVWDAYLPIGEDNDLAFQLGAMLLEMDYWSEALTFFGHSIDLYGLEPGTAYNMAVCHFGLRQMEQGLEWVNRALELDPEFDAAKALRIKMQFAAKSAGS